MLGQPRGVAVATTNSVSTNIPQAVLSVLATWAGLGHADPGRVCPSNPTRPILRQPNGWFQRWHPHFNCTCEVAEDVIDWDAGRGAYGAA